MKRIIDKATGLFIRDDLTANDGEIALDVKPAQGFYWPMWDGKQWVEGKTAEEIVPILAAKLQAEAEVVTETDIRTKLLIQINTLKTDLGASTDPAGSTTINAILNQTNSVINASPATYIKALARIMRTNQKADIRDIRLILRDLSEPDTDT